MSVQRELLALLTDSFGTDEIRGLLIALDVDPDRLVAPTASRDEIAQAVILHFRRRKDFASLVAEIKRQREDIVLPPELAALLPSTLPEPETISTAVNEQTAVATNWSRWLALAGLLVLLVFVAVLAGQLIFGGAEPFTFTTAVMVQDSDTLDPLANAQVTLSLVGGYAPEVAFTDNNGAARFTLDGALANTEARLSVRLDGYETQDRNVTLFYPDQTPVEMRLEPDETEP